MSTFILDFEGMYNKEQAIFYIQEFAYYEIDTNNCKNYFLSLPADVDYNKHVHVYKNINYIPPDYGTTKFNKIIEFLQQNAIFFIKGDLKFNFLKKITKSHVINLKQFMCPNLTSLSISSELKCSFIRHYGINNCALNKVVKLAAWFKQNKISNKLLIALLNKYFGIKESNN